MSLSVLNEVHTNSYTCPGLYYDNYTNFCIGYIAVFEFVYRRVSRDVLSGERGVRDSPLFEKWSVNLYKIYSCQLFEQKQSVNFRFREYIS